MSGQISEERRLGRRKAASQSAVILPRSDDLIAERENDCQRFQSRGAVIFLFRIGQVRIRNQTGVSPVVIVPFLSELPAFADSTGRPVFVRVLGEFPVSASTSAGSWIADVSIGVGWQVMRKPV